MRFTTLTNLCTFTLLAMMGVAHAHDPMASPLGKVTQQIGAVEVSVEYSRPGVKKRTVWGELVPYGKLWRTGANASTKITFGGPVTFGGTRVPGGTYSLLTIPTAKAWTVILNRNTSIRGALDNYAEAEDVARVTVPVTKGGFRERLTFVFSDTADDGAILDIEWERLRVRVPIKAGL